MLETDARNRAERYLYDARRAAQLYRDRVREGVNTATAHAEACAYLRRKTQWAAPMAAAALDDELRD